MADDTKKQIFDRYFNDYLERVRQGTGLWAKLGRVARKSMWLAASASALGVGAVLVSMAAPALIPGVLGFSIACIGTANTVLASHFLARYKTNKEARQKLSGDIKEGYVVDRDNAIVMIATLQNTPAAQKSLSGPDRPARRDGFQNAATPRFETDHDSTAKPRGVQKTSNNRNSLK